MISHSQTSPDCLTQALPTTDVQLSGPASFWVSDSTLSVHLRLAGGEDAEPWVQAIEEAMSTRAEEDKTLESGASNESATPVESQGVQLPQSPSCEGSSEPSKPQAHSGPLPPNMPKPSTRYLSAYRARHNLGRPSVSEASVAVKLGEEASRGDEASMTTGALGGAKF